MSLECVFAPRISAKTSARLPVRACEYFADLLAFGPQEHIGLEFLADRVGKVISPLARCAATTSARCRSAWLPGSMVSAKRALASVYSWPKWTIVWGGKLAQSVERGPHLLHRALDHPAAAQREQRVAGEEQMLLGKCRRYDPWCGRAWRSRVTSRPANCKCRRRQRICPCRESRRLARADDGAAERLFEREIAFDMVAMVMGGEDMGEFPALGLELALDGRVPRAHRSRRWHRSGGHGRGRRNCPGGR